MIFNPPLPGQANYRQSLWNLFLEVLTLVALFKIAIWIIRNPALILGFPLWASFFVWGGYHMIIGH